MTIHLDGPGVSIADVVAVARRAEPVELTDSAMGESPQSRAIVDRLAEGEPKYGISTGFGALATVSIPPERRQALQTTLVRSHAAGMGGRSKTKWFERWCSCGPAPSPSATVALDRWSPKRWSTSSTPVSRRWSPSTARSVRAAISPPSPMERWRCSAKVRSVRGNGPTAAEALEEAGLESIALAEKEGLAVTNGTDAILGMLCLAIADTQRLLNRPT